MNWIDRQERDHPGLLYCTTFAALVGIIYLAFALIGIFI